MSPLWASLRCKENGARPRPSPLESLDLAVLDGIEELSAARKWVIAKSHFKLGPRAQQFGARGIMSLEAFADARTGDRVVELHPLGSATYEFGCHGCALSKRRRQIPFRKVDFAAVGGTNGREIGAHACFGRVAGQNFSAVQVADPEALSKS